MELVTISPNWFLWFIVFPHCNDLNACLGSQLLSHPSPTPSVLYVQRCRGRCWLFDGFIEFNDLAEVVQGQIQGTKLRLDVPWKEGGCHDVSSGRLELDGVLFLFEKG